jgi:hypothetical protein
MNRNARFVHGVLLVCEVFPSGAPHRSTYSAVNQATEEDRNAGFESERTEIGALIGTPNQVESIQAYFEKRDPVYADPEK